MIKSLRRRFILFSVLVIGGIVVLISLYIFLGAPNTRPWHSYVTTFLTAISFVVIGSWLLSKAAIRPVQKAWQQQLDFTADASHELRTPIAVMRTNLELVMDSPEETVASQMKWLRNIEAENHRMARLVEDLLTLSRADTGQQTTQKETFMLDEALSEALAPFVPVAEAQRIELSIDIHKPSAFYGDRKRIKQLAVILVDNALHYTDSGKIAVTLGESERERTLTVSDTGRGIAAEHLGKIFDRFYRATDTRAMHQEGSGLGLSIAKWIASEHGGTIRAESAPGEGTVFIVRLPHKR